MMHRHTFVAQTGLCHRFHELGSGMGVPPVRFDSNGRDACATSYATTRNADFPVGPPVAGWKTGATGSHRFMVSNASTIGAHCRSWRGLSKSS
jgi:hypothetical protein